jgi:HEAT repeat protein
MGILYLFKPNVRKLKAKKDVEKLINALKYKDENVRMNALEALVMIGKPAVTPLIRTIGDSQYFQEHQYVRSYATWALGKIGDAKAIKPLIQALNDMDPNVRINAACALGMMGRAVAIKPLIQALETDSYVEKNATWALGMIGEQAVEPLVQVMSGHNSDSVRETARKTLVKIGWRPKNDIERAYSLIKNGQLSDYTWSELIKIGEPAVEPINRILYESNYYETRIKAVKALGSIGNTRAIECLILSLDDSDYRVTKTIEETLKEMGELAVEPLINDLNNRVYAQCSVVEVLGSLGDERAVEPLIQALKDKRDHVRTSAAKALEEIGWQPKDDIERAYYLVALSPSNAVELGEAAVEPLINLLGEAGYQSDAAKALGKIGDKRAAEALIKAWETREDRWGMFGGDILEALGEIGEAAVEPIIQAFRDVSKDGDGCWDMSWAEGALIDIGESAVEPIIQALRDALRRDGGRVGDWGSFTYHAAKSLEGIGVAAVEPLIQALKDKNDSVRKTAAESLGRIGGKRAVEPLIHALKDKNYSVRETAAKSLGRMWDKRAVEPLIQALKDKNNSVRETETVATALELLKIG